MKSPDPDNADDIYERLEQPQYATAIIIGVVLIVFVSVAHFADDSTPFFAAMASGVCCALCMIMWRLRRRKLLWLMLCMVALLHIMAIVLIRRPAKVSFGFAFMPLAAVDALTCYKIIIVVLKKFDKSKVRE